MEGGIRPCVHPANRDVTQDRRAQRTGQDLLRSDPRLGSAARQSMTAFGAAPSLAPLLRAAAWAASCPAALEPVRTIAAACATCNEQLSGAASSAIRWCRASTASAKGTVRSALPSISEAPVSSHSTRHRFSSRTCATHRSDAGDVFRRDADEVFYRLGRAASLFVSGSENIFPGEVASSSTRLGSAFAADRFQSRRSAYGEFRPAALRPSRPFGDQRRYPESGRRLALDDGLQMCAKHCRTRRTEAGGRKGPRLSVRIIASGQRAELGARFRSS